MTKSITLTQGKVALVDDEDFEYLNQWKWFAEKRGSGLVYAVRNVKQKPLHMHTQIIKTPKGMVTDHINGDGLDNRRCNLRACTHGENMRNRKVGQVNNKSGYKGAHWSKRQEKWKAEIRVNGKSIHLGYFNDLIEAAQAYDRAARKYHGKFAKLNFHNV